MPGITQDEFQASLAKFVSRLSGGRKIAATTLLFSDGLIDSLKILDLIAFVESALGIHIPDRKITAAGFRTIQCISKTFWKQRRQYERL